MSTAHPDRPIVEATGASSSSSTPRKSSWRTAFERVQPGDRVPEPPAGLKTWTSQTFNGIFLGTFLGGYRGVVLSRSSAPSPIPVNSHVHRTATFVVRESILTGARVGVFMSLFSATALAANGFGMASPGDYAIGGGLTCGLFAGALGGFRTAIPTAGFGATVGALAGVAQSFVMDWAEKLKATETESKQQSGEQLAICEEDEDKQRGAELVHKVISRYEQGLSRNLEDSQTGNNDELEPNVTSAAVDGEGSADETR